jgi:hypothetical protein
LIPLFILPWVLGFYIISLKGYLDILEGLYNILDGLNSTLEGLDEYLLIISCFTAYGVRYYHDSAVLKKNPVGRPPKSPRPVFNPAAAADLVPYGHYPQGFLFGNKSLAFIYRIIFIPPHHILGVLTGLLSDGWLRLRESKSNNIRPGRSAPQAEFCFSQGTPNFNYFFFVFFNY